MRVNLCWFLPTPVDSTGLSNQLWLLTKVGLSAPSQPSEHLVWCARQLEVTGEGNFSLS